MAEQVGNWFSELNWKNIVWFAGALLVFFVGGDVVVVLTEYFDLSANAARYMEGVSKILALLIAWYNRSPKNIPLGTK